MPTSTTIDVTPYLPMLLEVDDLAVLTDGGAGGSGGTGSLPVWREGNPLNDADFDDATGAPCDDTALNPTIIERLRPVTGRQFEPDNSTETWYMHLIEFLAVGEPSRLSTDMDLMSDAFEACADNPTWGGVPVWIEPLELPAEGQLGPLGDQRSAFTMWAMPGMDGDVGMDTSTGAGTGTGTGTGTPSTVRDQDQDQARDMTCLQLPDMVCVGDGPMFGAAGGAAQGPGPGAVWLVRTATIRVAGVMITVSLTEIVEIQVPASGAVPKPVPAITDAQFIELVEIAAQRLYT